MFDLEWTEEAEKDCNRLRKEGPTKNKRSKQAGLFRQVVKTLKLLQDNPKHPGLNTHRYWHFDHPTNLMSMSSKRTFRTGHRVLIAYSGAMVRNAA